MRIGFRELIFFIVLLAVPIASFLVVFKPRNTQIRAATEEVEFKQSRLDKLAEVSGKIDDLELAIERGRQSVEEIEEMLPIGKEVDVILENVWQIAQDNGLVVKSVKTDKPVPAAEYKELPLMMMLEGQFDGFYEFLLELENLPRITRIRSMDLDRVTDPRGVESGPGYMKADFTLSIYFADAG
ncbi:MAG: type IV pilus inner membrane component PilO [Planctomycetota bacterium]|jgi:type IV pilus assembly protein PilO